MDAHYDMVMKARAQAPEGERLYFAYSTILDSQAFATWKDQHGYSDFALPQGTIADAMDVTLTFDFMSRWWNGRVAGLKDSKGHSVWGVLFRIPGRDFPIIAHKEGGVTQMCVERQVRVRVAGNEVTAIAFTTNPKRASVEGDVSPSFLKAMQDGARSSGLPAEWVDSILRLAAQ